LRAFYFVAKEGFKMEMYGRRVITTDAVEITDANIVDELTKAMNTHNLNRGEIEYLWNYYRGKQPILQRKKLVRPEICNKIVENRANEIVSFKVGYLCGEPIQYVGRNGDERVSQAIAELNEMMFSENKATQDKEIVEWQMICGIAYRLVLPDSRGEEDEVPFEMFTLDPRDTFVVKSSEVGNKPMFAVKYRVDSENNRIASVYSANHYWRLVGDRVVESKPHALGMIPIFEYPANNALLGAFEIVLPMLDAINNVASNRMDGIEQFIQSFIKFVNCDIDEEQFKALKEMGAIKVKSVDGSTADVSIVTQELNQMQTQTLVDYLYQTVLTICGMPNRNGGSSTSDTGSAVMMRDGWTLAEARAKDSELMFKRAENEVLKLVLRILRDTRGLSEDIYNLRLKNISMQFTRRNYENIQSKAQVLVSMLQQNKIHPRLAFTSSGLFTDPESAYQLSKEYAEEQAKKALEMVKKQPLVGEETVEEGE
jgi:SPP1 family phage portal protein